MKSMRVFDELSSVNDFDLQLFGADGDTLEIGATPKVNIGGKEYTAKEIEEGITALANKKAWEKSNTEKAQAIADEKKKFTEEQEVSASWMEVGKRYTQDEAFQKEFDRIYSGELPTEHEEETPSSDPKIKAMAEEIASLKKETERMQDVELEKMMLADMREVAAAITSDKDPFTIEDVEALALKKKKTYGEAYQLMKAQHLDHYRRVAGEAAIEDYKKKQPPVIPPIGSGGGVYREITPFKGWNNAAAEAAKSFDVFK